MYKIYVISIFQTESKYVFALSSRCLPTMQTVRPETGVGVGSLWCIMSDFHDEFVRLEFCRGEKIYPKISIFTNH
jgi:hypothetical protein